MLKILVVDDENLVRIALRTMVNWEEHGFDFVGTASDGSEALSMVEKYAPDIVVTDLKMPDTDGIQLIKSLRERKFNGKILVLSNYGEFELVKQALLLGAVDYILKVTMIPDNFIALLKNIGGSLYSEREMQDKLLTEQIQLKQSKSILKNNFFKDLFSEDTAFDYQRIILEAGNAGLAPALSKSFMFYIVIDNYEQALQNSKADDRKQLVFSMQNIIREYLSMIPDLNIVEIDHRRMVVLIPSGEFRLMESLPEKTAEKIAGQLNLYLNIHVSIVVSAEFEGFYGAKTMYGNCAHALNLKFYSGESIVCIDNHKAVLIPEKLNYAAEIKQIWPLFASGDLAGIVAQLKIIMENAQKECYDPNFMKKYVIRLVEGIEIEVYKTNSTHEPVFESMKERIFNTETLVDLLRLVSELLANLYNMWRKEDSHNYRKEVNDIIQFIHHNYHKKITISMIANKVNLNESYICRIFKSGTNRSIFTYINEVRMEKAAELLRDKNIPIKNIACEVGIEDQFYFNRVFKKYFGVNPTSYKNRLMPPGQNNTK